MLRKASHAPASVAIKGKSSRSIKISVVIFAFHCENQSIQYKPSQTLRESKKQKRRYQSLGSGKAGTLCLLFAAAWVRRWVIRLF